jgi:hypothetical protein
MPEHEDLIQKILDADSKARAAETANPVSRLSRIEQENARLARENAAFAKEHGLDTRIAAAGERNRSQKQAAKAHAHKAAIEALYAEAWNAIDDPDNEVEVEVEDEDGFVYDQIQNPVFEDAVARLFAVGQEAQPYLAQLHEEYPLEVQDVAELVVQRDAAMAQVNAQKAMEAAIAQRATNAKRIEARVEELINLNPQFLPEHPELVAEIEHWTDAAKRLETPDEKRAAIQQVKNLEVEQTRRALAQERAARSFVEFLNEYPADTPFEVVEEAFIVSLKLADAEYTAMKEADSRTRSFQAQADAAEIGSDSRTKDGRLVLVSPDGKQTLEVTDDGAGPLLLNDWVPIRDFQAPAQPDYEESLDPTPSEYEQALAFADRMNSRDFEAEAEEAILAHAARMNESKAAHAEAEAERTQRNSGRSILEAMEKRLGRDDGSND